MARKIKDSIIGIQIAENVIVSAKIILLKFKHDIVFIPNLPRI